MLSAYVIDYSGIDPYVQLNWDPVEGSTSYEVYRYTAKTKAYVKIATIAHSDKVFSFNYMDSDLAFRTLQLLCLYECCLCLYTKK